MSGPTIAHRLRYWAEATPDRSAFVFLRDGEVDEVRMTFAEIDLSARGIAALLGQRMAPGSRVLLLFPFGLEYISAFFGCLYAGMIAVPAYPPEAYRLPATLPRLRAIVEDCRPAALFSSATLAQSRGAVVRELPQLAHIPWLTPPQDADEITADDVPPLGLPEATAVIQYTSGSTGEPKGVVLSNDNIWANQQVIQAALGLDSRSVAVGWLPLYHDMGLIGNVLHSVYTGLTCVLLSPFHFLQRPIRWLRAIERFRATASGAPNFGYALCTQKVAPEERATLDLSNWRVAFSGAEPLRAATLDDFGQAFAVSGFRPTSFRPCYGLAEATLMVSCGTSTPQSSTPVRTLQRGAYEANLVVPTREGEIGNTLKVVSCGRPAGDVQVVVADPETRVAVRPGQIGEIWVRGRGVARGYWNRPELTEVTFRAHLGDDPHAEFLRTGDLGFLLDGELVIAGRLKETIIVKGRKIHPNDLEGTAERSSPTIRTGGVVAFGVVDEDEEAVVVVAAVALKGTDENSQDVLGAILRRVAQTHEVQPRTIALVAPGVLPKTSSGKVRRNATRAAWAEGRLEVLARWDRPRASDGKAQEKVVTS